MALITNTIIQSYCKLGYNVPSATIYIQDAEDEFEQKIPAALFSRFEAVAAYSAWATGTTYTVGQYVTYSGSLWKCLIGNAASAPTSVNTNWSLQYIYIPFLYAQQSLSYLAYAKMLVEHGIEISGSGLVKYSGADSQTAISSQERAALVNKYQNKSDLWLQKMFKYISDSLNVIDGVTYTMTGTTIMNHNTNFGIF